MLPHALTLRRLGVVASNIGLRLLILLFEFPLDAFDSFSWDAVAEGKDILPPKHNSASTAFYVAVEFGAQKRKTKTIKNSLEPAWNEAFDLYVSSGSALCAKLDAKSNLG